MEYNKIVSVTGLPGLYELINTKSDGAVIRSLDDKSTKFASTRIHNFSHLESIEVYTVGDNVNLADVFRAMEKAGSEMPDPKDDTAIKKYFEKVYPDIDFARVYNSDLKKMIKWYEALKKHNVEIKISEAEVSTEESPAEDIEVVAEPPKETEKSKPKSKTSGKPKEATEKTEKKSTVSKADKPAKKAAPKKGK